MISMHIEMKTGVHNLLDSGEEAMIEWDLILTISLDLS